MEPCVNTTIYESPGGYRALSAALRGDVGAQYQLGVILEEEQKDLELASEWFKKAAMQGHKESAYRAALLCMNRSLPPEEAAYWFYKAAAAGHPIAQFCLADLYERGVGVKLDPEASLYWHRLAAKQGNSRSKEKLETLSNWWSS